MRIVSALFATMVAAVAAPSGPGDAAMAYLEKVRTGQVDLEPGADTAIARETSRAKRREIARRLERMAADLGDEELELGPVKQDGDLAAVLVRRSPGFDPTSLHIFPVALVRREDRWLPAPLPSSFENSGLHHRSGFRERLDALESWMLRTRASDLLTLRNEAAARIRRRIEQGLPLEKLRGMNSRQVADCFLAACARRDLAVVIGLLGGLSEPQPPDLRARIRICKEVLNDPSPAIRPWHLLCSGEILRAVVHEEEDRNDALVSLACIDPRLKMRREALPGVEFVHIEFVRGRDDLWRADPGETFWAPSEEDEPEDEDAVLDGDLLDKFPARLMAEHPAVSRLSAAEAEAAMLAAARKRNPAALLEIARIPENPGIARIAIGRVVNLWRLAHHPAPGAHLVPLARTERDGIAISYMQLLSPRHPDEFHPVTLVFRQEDGSWLWDPDSLAAGDGFADWLKEQEAHWPSAWRGKLLSASLALDRLPDLPAPSREDAQAAVETWLRLVAEGDLTAALAHCVRVLGEDGQREMLRRAAMEMHDAAGGNARPEFAPARVGKRLALVEAGLPHRGETLRPLYPVIATPDGPRILLELDLFAGGSRTRQFLNRTAADRLRRVHPDAAEELEELLRSEPAAAEKSGD